MRKPFTPLQGCHLKNGALTGFSRHRAETTALCPAQGIAAESPDDDRREEEDLQRKARPPRRAGDAPECLYGANDSGNSPHHLENSPRYPGNSPHRLGNSPRRPGNSSHRLGNSPRHPGNSPRHLENSPR
ncbi:MAG: hypothetical protein LBH90_07685 [Tannerella sp.]|nr:hypothetical protein [Tannerella sp.]